MIIVKTFILYVTISFELPLKHSMSLEFHKFDNNLYSKYLSWVFETSDKIGLLSYLDSPYWWSVSGIESTV